MEGYHVCQLIDETTNQCLQWVPFSIIPTLTDEARDQLLLIMISTYISVLVVRAVKSLILKSD
ncbi:hypothetical protein F938_02055 [Acinetobacter bereziniae LMG 1003 = CIP 70.12]|uniref:Uncharacterized protein n=1 Tax=Acinetobacter bereziniae LMG 1003 = CIP 70.12 TaxID=981324 RepID=N9DFS3_ACIBZ|nr:hypothetical protein F938_02055 [Acinetobacter bereziniae LMG 1003 = CIP 70.12]